MMPYNASYYVNKLEIHQGFLRFLPCICLLLAENPSIS